LSSDKPTNENIFTVPRCSSRSEDLFAVGVTPPVSANWRPGDGLGQLRNWPLGAFQNNAVTPNENESVDRHGRVSCITMFITNERTARLVCIRHLGAVPRFQISTDPGHGSKLS